MNEFSFYEKGYTSRKATKNIDLQQIYEYIKNHPQKERILHLRTLSKDDYCYSKIKGTLPCITPHGTFQTSKKKENMILLSEYLYFDIDLMTIEESENIKDNLVGNYKKYIALIGKSVGGRGLFLYMKVKGLTPANFTSVQQYFIEDVFKEYPIDTNAKGITRCHVLPFDENVFYNEEHEYFQVPKELLYNTKNTTDSVYKKSNTTCYTPPSVFRDISEVWNKLTLKTAVDVGNNLFVIKPVDYYKLFIPANIQDGKKHKVFLVSLNLLKS